MSAPPLTPTLGCQIAPHYEHDYDSADSSDSSSEDQEEQQDGGVPARVASEVSFAPVVEYVRPLPYSDSRGDRETADLEKVETAQETAQDVAAVRTPIRPILRSRTKSNRSRQPEPPVGFFHWKMAGVRLHVLKLWLRTNLILAIAIFALLSLFWGALFHQDKRVGILKVLVVNFDTQQPESFQPFVGKYIEKMSLDPPLPDTRRLGWTAARPEEFGNDPIKVREAVYDFHAWAAVIINANATVDLEAAFLNSSRLQSEVYEPSAACQIIVNSARDPTTTSTYVLPALIDLRHNIMRYFGQEWIPRMAAVSPPRNLDDILPMVISPGIDCTMIDLRPFGPPIATPATSIGLIYLIIISFFSFTFFLPIHLKYLSPRGHPPLHFTHLIAWRYFATVASYFLLSCVYSLVSLAFCFPFSSAYTGSHVEQEIGITAYGKATWMVYWMVNWLGMTALGLASENMAMMLGTPWTALWLIFWVISNVSTGFYPIALENAFYRWGYAWPIHNVAEATRQILFDLHPRIGLNLGVLLAWVVIGTALFPLCCFYMRWNTARVKKAAAAKDAAWHEQMEKEREDPSLLARITTAQKKPA